MDTQEDCFHLGAKALIFNGEGKLLLLKFDPDKFKRELWDIPGGRVQKKELIEETLRREVEEESGLKNITNIRPFIVAISNRRIQKEDIGLFFATYLCDMIGDPTIRLSEEYVDFGWFEPKRAAGLLVDRYPLELIEKLTTLSL